MIPADPLRNLGPATILRGDARHIPLADNTVDLIVTSPPYFALRSYQDAGEHYAGQIGSEPTPAEFVDALIECTREMVRVLKPSGSIWVNLGDKYDSGTSSPRGNGGDRMKDGRQRQSWNATSTSSERATIGRPKSLLGIPWRYALRCIDDLGLILRAEVIWSKPNGLPESVADRVRRSHEQWFHFTLQPRYYSAVDEIREAYGEGTAARYRNGYKQDPSDKARIGKGYDWSDTADGLAMNPLGKLPGSVWTIATEPLNVPADLGVDHFAAFPSEWPKRIIRGWSPAGVCTACGEGRRPVVDKELVGGSPFAGRDYRRLANGAHTGGPERPMPGGANEVTITGYACDCTPWHIVNDAGDETKVYLWHTWVPPLTIPAIVLDPFGGTGTTAMVARALGRHGITLDLSNDYCRLAQWRCANLDQLAAVQGHERTKRQADDSADLLSLLADGEAS